MIENQVLGKLLPSHESIQSILKEIRYKYQIPEISPTDEGMEIILRQELDLDWKIIHSEILEKIKASPDIFPEKYRRLYKLLNNYQEKISNEPELEKVSKEFRDNFNTIMDLFMSQFLPIVQEMDIFFHTITDLSVEYLITGVAREVPENWFLRFYEMNSFGEKVLVMQTNAAVDPDEAAEKFKKKFKATYGKRKIKLTEKHVKTADFLRMRWEGKSYQYLIEEIELRNPKEFQNKPNSRHSASKRRKNDKIRQQMNRMIKDLNKVLL